MGKIIADHRCTGCKMCGDLCPQGAISFTDKEGFWYPVIDQNKCTDCGLCVSRCPATSGRGIVPTGKAEVYAAWSMDYSLRMSSTSGGLFSELAKLIIKQGGIVVGCEYSDDYRSARHVLARTREDLERLKGSKYFQSDTQGVYKAVKQELDRSTQVLFIGTPCQLAALRAYLDRDYENLIYIDFICRSICSPVAHRAYLDELESQHKSKVTKVQAKYKDKWGWESRSWLVEFANGQHVVLNKDHCWYDLGLHGNLYNRQSCYQCRFRTMPRNVADITLADFWGIKNQRPEDYFTGISLVMLNTQKGIELFNRINDKLYTQERTVREVISSNPSVLKPPLNLEREQAFFKMIQTKSFSKTVQKLTGQTLMGKGVVFVRKTFRKLKWLTVLSLTQFIWLNYVSKKVDRDKKSHILPHRGAKLDIHRTARIMLRGGNLIVNDHKLKQSRAEAYIRMEAGSRWVCNNGCNLFYHSVIETKQNALFETQGFAMNSNSAIICANHINIGENVLVGRNVTVYDSDFHSIYTVAGEVINPSQGVTIGNRVWLPSNVSVLNGACIGDDTIVSAMTVVNSKVPPNSIYKSESKNRAVEGGFFWLL